VLKHYERSGSKARSGCRSEGRTLRSAWLDAEVSITSHITVLPKKQLLRLRYTHAGRLADKPDRAASIAAREFQFCGFKAPRVLGIAFHPGEWPELIFKLLVRQRYGASFDAVRVVPIEVMCSYRVSATPTRLSWSSGF